MTTSLDRRQLQALIAGFAEGILLIEPDHRIAWANPAALTMHGVKSVGQIGTTISGYRKSFALRYRNNHPLDHKDYPIERLAAGDLPDDVVVEVSSLAEPQHHWVHRCRGFVVVDSAGAPECLVLVIVDETERYAAEDRFERAFSANPAPAVICRLSDLRFVRANAGFIDMTGYTREQILGRSTYEIDLFHEAKNRALAIERLGQGRTVPQMEAAIPLPDGGTRFVIVAGQPIEMGEDACMLFTFADLELRRKAETALKASEARFATSFRLSPVPIVLVTLADLTYLAVNEAFTATFGFNDQEVAGRTAADLGLWVEPAARAAFAAEIARSEHVRNAEARLWRKDGSALDGLISAERVTINDEACVLSVVTDITERKRNERELIEAIDAVMADTSWFSRGVIERLAALRHPGRPQVEAGPDLSSRERHVLGLMCQGLADAAIGTRLSLSPNTVRNHVAALYRKLDLHRRAEVVLWGRERGF